MATTKSYIELKNAYKCRKMHHKLNDAIMLYWLQYCVSDEKMTEKFKIAYYIVSIIYYIIIIYNMICIFTGIYFQERKTCIFASIQYWRGFPCIFYAFFVCYYAII